MDTAVYLISISDPTFKNRHGAINFSSFVVLKLIGCDVALSQLDKGVWCRLRAGSDSSCFNLAPEQKRKKRQRKRTRHMLASFASVQINVKTQY